MVTDICSSLDNLASVCSGGIWTFPTDFLPPCPGNVPKLNPQGAPRSPPPLPHYQTLLLDKVWHNKRGGGGGFLNPRPRRRHKSVKLFFLPSFRSFWSDTSVVKWVVVAAWRPLVLFKRYLLLIKKRKRPLEGKILFLGSSKRSKTETEEAVIAEKGYFLDCGDRAPRYDEIQRLWIYFYG